MRWTDLPTEAGILPPERLLSRWADDPETADLWRQRLAGPQHGGPWVLIDRRAVEEALAAIGGVTEERGGLLIGHVYGRDAHALGDDTEVTAVTIRTAVAGAGAEASAVSLRLPATVWSAAQAALQPGERIVGWFHSHPGFGAFFSDTDRQTQAAFFREPFSLGWVIDPFRQDQAWFVGPSSSALALERITMT